jgi:hypothetical protein
LFEAGGGRRHSRAAALGGNDSARDPHRQAGLIVLAVHDYPEAVAARVEDSGAGADARMAERTSPEAAGVVQK